MWLVLVLLRWLWLRTARSTTAGAVAAAGRGIAQLKPQGVLDGDHGIVVGDFLIAPAYDGTVGFLGPKKDLCL
jgi:hypothetical protein